MAKEWPACFCGRRAVWAYGYNYTISTRCEQHAWRPEPKTRIEELMQETRCLMHPRYKGLKRVVRCEHLRCTCAEAFERVRELRKTHHILPQELVWE